MGQLKPLIELLGGLWIAKMLLDPIFMSDKVQNPVKNFTKKHPRIVIGIAIVALASPFLFIAIASRIDGIALRW